MIIALLGPALLGIDLEEACKRYEEKHGGKKAVGGPGHGLASVRVCAPTAFGRTRALSA